MLDFDKLSKATTGLRSKPPVSQQLSQMGAVLSVIPDSDSNRYEVSRTTESSLLTGESSSEIVKECIALNEGTAPESDPQCPATDAPAPESAVTPPFLHQSLDAATSLGWFSNRAPWVSTASLARAFLFITVLEYMIVAIQYFGFNGARTIFEDDQACRSTDTARWILSICEGTCRLEDTTEWVFGTCGSAYRFEDTE